MNKSFVTRSPLAAELVRVELRRRGWDYHDLAKAAGVSHGRVKNQMHAGIDAGSLRWKIENALDFMPIWSDPRETEIRRRCQAAFGIDPRLATLAQLRALCQRLNISRSGAVLSDQTLFPDLTAWFGANPRVGVPTTSNKNFIGEPAGPEMAELKH